MLKLPDLICLSDHYGDWSKYEEVLYSYFKQDFIDSKPIFNGTKLSLKKHPLFKEKEATFWHLISEGKIEDQRTPDMRRCERIRWPKPIIENHKDNDIKFWENSRKGEQRICLCYGDWEYLVVLSKRKNYILIWTAYAITKHHTKRKLKKEFEEYSQKSNTAP